MWMGLIIGLVVGGMIGATIGIFTLLFFQGVAAGDRAIKHYQERERNWKENK